MTVYVVGQLKFTDRAAYDPLRCAFQGRAQAIRRKGVGIRSAARNH
jgi:hypothetical protein